MIISKKTFLAGFFMFLIAGNVYCQNPAPEVNPAQNSNSVATTRDIVNTIGKTSQLAIESYQDYFAIVSWFAIGIMTLFAALLGGGIVTIVRPLVKIRDEHGALLEKNEDVLNELKDSKNNLEALSNAVAAYVVTVRIMTTDDKEKLEHNLKSVQRSVELGFRKNPTDTDILRWLHSIQGVVYRLQNDNVSALESIKASIKLDNTYADSLFNAGCCASLLHQTDEAISFINQALAADPTVKVLLKDKDLDNIRGNDKFPK